MDNLCKSNCASLSVLKVDSITEKGLEGAIFDLEQCERVNYRGTTNGLGILVFFIEPHNKYILKESFPPPGYEAIEDAYEIYVDCYGSVYVDGKQTNEIIIKNALIKSKPPVIRQIIEGSGNISGTGVPGAVVIVTFTDGSTVKAIVDPNREWEAVLPDRITLKPGDMVLTVQKEPDKLESVLVTELVVGPPDGYGYKYFRNISRFINIYAGDILTFMITIGNNSGIATVWPNVAVKDTIHENTLFLKGSVRINGIHAAIGDDVAQYTYDENARVLIVRLGDISPGDEFVITYRVRINDDWNGTAFSNSFEAFSDSDAHGAASSYTVNSQVIIKSDG